MTVANCRDADPALFFPERGKVYLVNNALALCLFCTVREECKEYRIRSESEAGVWGGELFTKKDNEEDDS